MYTTIIEKWMVDKKGNEYFGRETRFFETKEERDWFRAKYNMGHTLETSMKVIKESYNEYKSTEDFG